MRNTGKYCILALLTVLGSAFADESLPDARKLEIVYRMYADYQKDFPGAREISVKQAMSAAGQAVFVDTREPAEMEVSTLPGAISQAAFLKNPAAYRDKTVIAYCTIGYRSGKFAEEMAKKGIPVSNLKGGILAWTLESGKVLDRKGETRRIHVYGKKWDYAPAGYETVVFGLLEKLF